MPAILTTLPATTSEPCLLRAFADAGSGLPPPRQYREVVNAGPASDLPENQCKIVPIGSGSIGVFRVKDRLYAVRNQCPHRGAPLCLGRLGSTYLPKGASPLLFEETLVDRVLRCPWHGWEFDIATGKGLYDATGRVPTYAVRLNSAQEIEILV